MRRSPVLFPLAATAAMALFLSGCGQAANANQNGAAPDPAQARISVVATTSVYGDIARTIGGDRVQVTSIISKTSQDPHSYEPTPQDKLALSKADLSIGNGGGFDPFFDTITKDSGISQDRIIHAFDVAGVEGGGVSHTQGHPAEETAAAHGEVNEHVWYNMFAVSRIADEIATRLGAVDPGAAAGFAANAEKFKADAAAISDKLAAIKARHGGEGVALTEPLPLYILESAGLENRTPEDFLEAVEEGNDAPAGALKSTVDLVSSKSVRFLAYNDQTATPQTETVRKAAEAANLPVVNFTETLPEGKTFIQWMNDNADSIETALRP
jgi:zinc/manganese transport system substrate-binding protein